MFRKLLVVIILVLVSGYAFAEVGSGTLTHFGISAMRNADKTISHLIQVNGSLMPSVEREMIPYSDWKCRSYGYAGYEIKNQNYGFGVGYYLGRVGMVGIQAGILNDKLSKEDQFIYGCYFDGNVFKEMVRSLIGMAGNLK